METGPDGREYDGCTDEELIDRLRGGEKGIMDYICDKYKNLVRDKARRMFILGGDTQDLIQEGMIGLFKAVRDYDIGRDASFYTFAELCINRQLYTAVQASRRKKHLPLNSYVSLYDNVAPKDGAAQVSFLDMLEDEHGSNPEELVLDKEREEDLERVIENELSPFEKQVFDHYVTGMTYSQIAKVLGREEKSTDNALQRLKAKLKKKL